MIAPDMATMLSFVVTDAPIAAPVLQALLSNGRRRAASTRSPSTATPRPPTRCSSSPPARRQAPHAHRRASATGGSARSARRSTISSSTSPIRWCGTARARGNSSRCGSRARCRSARRSGSRCRSPIRRWSRRRSPARTPIGGAIVMAVGKAGEPADRDRLAIWFGDIRVAVEGRARPGLLRGGDIGLHEERGNRHHRRSSASATASDRVWTCDLTKEYVAINGDYRS